MFAMERPSCRACDEDIERSNKGLWKAVCLECSEDAKRKAAQRRDEEISRLRDRMQDLEEENEELRHTRNTYAYPASPGLRPPVSRYPPSGYSGYSGYSATGQPPVSGYPPSGYSASGQAPDSGYPPSGYSSYSGHSDAPYDPYGSCSNGYSVPYGYSAPDACPPNSGYSYPPVAQACCRDCGSGISVSHSGLWKAHCLDCTAAMRSKLQSMEGMAAHKDGTIICLRGEMNGLRSEVDSLRSTVDDLREEVEEVTEQKRRETSGLQRTITRLQGEATAAAALAVENLRLKSRVTALEQDRQELLVLKERQMRHEACCPAKGNEKMFQDAEHTDLCMTAGGEVYHVHRAVLASRSPVFASMLTHPMREANERLVQIEDMSSKALYSFLYFLYTGHFEPTFDPQELGSEILAAANKYDIPSMTEAIKQLMGIGPSQEHPSCSGLSAGAQQDFLNAVDRMLETMRISA